MEIITDFKKENVDCCLSHLIDVFTILGEFRDHVALVGGWIPYLLYNNPDDPHCGSMDIDMAIEFNAISDETYQTMLTALKNHGFSEGPQPYMFIKETKTDSGIPFKVHVDLLAGEYGGTTRGHRHQRVQDVKARKVRGADLVFQDTVVKTIHGQMPGGAINDVNIRVAGAVPFLVMKGMALWTREERKDAYDIYYLVSNYPGGIDGLAKAFEPYQKHVMVREGLSKIRSKFLNPEYIGPVWAAEFQAVQDPERNEQIKRDAFEKISRFLDRLGIEQYKGI